MCLFVGYPTILCWCLRFCWVLPGWVVVLSVMVLVRARGIYPSWSQSHDYLVPVGGWVHCGWCLVEMVGVVECLGVAVVMVGCS